MKYEEAEPEVDRFHDPLVDLRKKKKKTEAGGYAQISDSYVYMWYICYCYCIAGHS